LLVLSYHLPLTFGLHRISSLIGRMQKITRTLDLNAGCPETFVNPIWATVYEKEVLRGAKIPDGYDRIRCVDER